MNKKSYYKGLYLVGAIYDIVLGFGFLIFFKQIYEITGMDLPEKTGYISIVAVFIMIYGISLLMIFKDIERSRKLVIYAILVKFGWIIVILFYLVTQGYDYIGLPFIIFGILDVIFAGLFIESLRYIKK